jgi:hypothetical protein
MMIPRKTKKENIMVICPIAIVAGCEKCPAFKVCPLTKVLGDQKADVDKKAEKNSASGGKKKS